MSNCQMHGETIIDSLGAIQEKTKKAVFGTVGQRH
jgi:hypothetical protein